MAWKHQFGWSAVLCGGVLLGAAISVAGQQVDAPAPQPEVLAKQAQAAATSKPAAGAPISLSLQEALALARKNEPSYQAVATEAGVAREARAQARDALLPSVNFNTSALSTQANNSQLGSEIYRE